MFVPVIVVRHQPKIQLTGNQKARQIWNSDAVYLQHTLMYEWWWPIDSNQLDLIWPWQHIQRLPPHPPPPFPLWKKLIMQKRHGKIQVAPLWWGAGKRGIFRRFEYESIWPRIGRKQEKIEMFKTFSRWRWFPQKRKFHKQDSWARSIILRSKKKKTEWPC